MSELSQLKDAQYHLSKLEGLIKNNKWYSHLYSHLAKLAVEGELQRQVALLEKDKSEDIPDTEKLYDVLEVSTNGMNPPDASYTSLSRVVAAQKYESLLSEGISPDDIKIKRVK
ncbi:MAG: hypothetical protein CM15mL4_2280 [uncultured marine virus]|nr:MAG: hypothetical protein CM15mL4_2280 [uncultured marine virus]